MKKLIRTLVILIGLVVTLFVVAAAAFIAFFDPNDFKDQLAGEVEAATGRSLKIDGDLSLTLFPWLGVETGALTLGNAKGFEKQDFAHIDAANIRVKLLPLFSGNVEMDTVTLKGLNLNLTRLANGQDNWSDLGGKRSDKQPEATTDTSPVAALAIGGIHVDNATISWDDQKARQQVKLRQLNLRTGALGLGAAVPFTLQTLVTSNQPQVEGKVDLQATVRANPFAGEYIADNLKLKVDMQGKGLPSGKLDAALNTNVSANLIEQKLGLRNIELAILGMVATGELNASNILKTPTYQGKVDVAPFSPRTLLTLTGSQPPKTADPKVLEKASLSSMFSGSKNSLKLDGLQARLDDTNLTGTVSIRDFNKLAAQFDLQLDQIDLDRYRNAEAANAAATPAAAASAAAPILPVDLLRSLNVSGKAQIGKLRIAKLDVTDIQMQANAQQGDIRLAPMTARLAEGTYEGDVRIDVRGNEPVISMNERMQGVQAETLVKTFTGYDSLRGVGNLDARLTTRGNTDASLRSNLNGTINFNLKDGLIKGVNIDHLLRTAYATIKRKPLPSDRGIKDTVFTSLSASSTVTNGVLSNRDLAITTDNLRINGEGDVNLVNETMQYRLATNVIKSYEGPDSEEFNELKRLTVPVIIKGPLANLSYNVDLERLLTQKVQQDLQQKLKDKLFGKEQKPAETAPATSTQPTQQPALTPEEERRLRKEEESRKKKEAAEKLLKGLFK